MRAALEAAESSLERKKARSLSRRVPFAREIVLVEVALLLGRERLVLGGILLGFGELRLRLLVEAHVERGNGDRLGRPLIAEIERRRLADDLVRASRRRGGEHKAGNQHRPSFHGWKPTAVRRG